jgi:PIN domain nuclease of toxin-antitoxin system
VKLLIDAHTLLWTVDEPHRLPARVMQAMADPNTQRLVSAGTIWEFGIKVGQKKLKISLPFRAWITKAITDTAAQILPITIDVAEVQGALPRHHGDPFDRLLVAHAILEGASIASIDNKLDAYGVVRIW